jgi:heat shock protein HslJ
MQRSNKMPLAFIIIIIIIASIVFIKFRKDNDAIGNLPTPSVSPLGKLPAGSTPVGSTDLIIGHTWSWERTVMNDDSIIIPKNQNKFTIEFSRDGNVMGKTDCNSFSGTYQIGSDGIINFGPLASTKMYCEGSEETLFTGAISKVKNYSVDTVGNKLLMYFNEGLMILDLVK